MRTLYEISNDFAALESILEEMGGEIPDALIESQIDSFLDNLLIERDTKLDNCAALIREFDARSEIRAAEAARLFALADADAKRANRLSTRVKAFFERHGIETAVETPRFRLKLQKNGGKIPVEITKEVNPSELPENLRRVKFELDKDNVRAALEAGEELDFARLGERGTHLRIN